MPMRRGAASQEAGGNEAVYLADSEGVVLSVTGTRGPGEGPSPRQGVTVAASHQMVVRG